MNFTARLSALALMLALTGAAAATPASSIPAPRGMVKTSLLPLSGGSIAPHVTDWNTLAISVSSLPDGVPYNVVCNITSNAQSGQTSDDVFVSTQSYNQVNVEYDLNDSPYVNSTSSTAVLKIKTGMTNTLTVLNVYRSMNSLNFMNLDNTDTITVSNCSASPSVNSGT